MTTVVLALSCATTAHGQTRQRGFSVILLLGEMQGASPAENLPVPVRKALADVKDFLPYRGYRVLATELLLGSRGATSRVSGLDDQEYDVEVSADEFPPNPLNKGKEGMLIVLFKLQEVGAPTMPGEEFGRAAMAADMERQRAELQRRIGEGASGAVAQELKARIASFDKNIRMARARKLIDSRFEMAVGETVVVGTSKMGGGDKGLVVLLTSVAGGK